MRLIIYVLVGIMVVFIGTLIYKNYNPELEFIYVFAAFTIIIVGTMVAVDILDKSSLKYGNY